MCSAPESCVAEVSTVASENFQQETCSNAILYLSTLAYRGKSTYWEFYSFCNQMTDTVGHWFQPTVTQSKNII